MTENLEKFYLLWPCLLPEVFCQIAKTQREWPCFAFRPKFLELNKAFLGTNRPHLTSSSDWVVVDYIHIRARCHPYTRHASHPFLFVGEGAHVLGTTW